MTGKLFGKIAPRDNGPASAEASIRRLIIAGSLLVGVLVLGLGGWASTAEISGALIAQGTIVVDSNIKKVQHPTGGVVGEVRVHDGDRVKAGDILIRLDETVTRANLAIVTKGLNELYARKARLGAERDGGDTMAVPRELADSIDNPDVKDAMDPSGSCSTCGAPPARTEKSAAGARQAIAGAGYRPGRAAGCQGQGARLHRPGARRRARPLAEEPGPAQSADLA